jgi:hypothetical protein
MPIRTSRREALLVLVGRLVLLLGAVVLLLVSLRVLAGHGENAESAAFSCPMHPEVVSDEAAECPICKMALERVGSAHDRRSAVACETSGDRSLVAPSAVSSAATGVAPSPLGVTWLPETHPPTARSPSPTAALGTPRFRTFSDAVRAPSWVEAPDRIAALLHRDDLVGLTSRERGTFFRALAPRTPIDVRLGADPPEPWDGSTVLVRFVAVPAASARPAGESENPWRAGDVGFLELEGRQRDLLVVPESAVLRSSEGAYVLVASPDGSFVRRSIELGRARRGLAVVVSGLGERDEIVVGNAFFHDARVPPARSPSAVAGVGP